MKKLGLAALVLGAFSASIAMAANFNIDSNTSDLWWGYDWNDASKILTAMITHLRAGSHIFEGYWAKGCSNGGLGLKISSTMASTPIPATIWLFGSGVAGLFRSGRRKQIHA